MHTIDETGFYSKCTQMVAKRCKSKSQQITTKTNFVTKDGCKHRITGMYTQTHMYTRPIHTKHTCTNKAVAVSTTETAAVQSLLMHPDRSKVNESKNRVTGSCTNQLAFKPAALAVAFAVAAGRSSFRVVVVMLVVVVAIVMLVGVKVTADYCDVDLKQE